MVVGESKRTANIMEGIENTGDVRLHDHRLRLKQRFDIVRKLGQGTYGKVQLGINKKTGQEVAIKTIKKCKIESEADLIRIRREVQIMSSVRHPNIVHIYEVFENSEKMILVMEYCSGGELYDYLSQKKVLQEDEARRLFRQIATAVYYCHIHKICHRDLKLENVLLDDTGSAKIADFGLSNVFKETSLLSTFCGSPLYASPEIVKGTPYIGPEVDCWSLGVLLYTLVYGAMPFDGSNFKRLVRQISTGDYYEPKNPSSASPLIRDMLTVDPLKRADIAYICDNPWVNVGCESSCLEVAEALAAETPVRLDLLLSLAPAAATNCNALVVPAQAEQGAEESGTDLTSSTSMAVEPSNSAEKRILELVAEGGEDAIKPSPTRTIVSAGDGKRKLEVVMSASGLHRKKERVASSARIPPESPPEPPLQEEPVEGTSPPKTVIQEMTIQPSLKSSATITIAPSPEEPVKETKEPPKETHKEEVKEKPTTVRPRVSVKKKLTPKAADEKPSAEKQEETKQEEPKPSSVATAADKLTSLSLSQQSTTNQTPAKPKKLSIPGGNVGSFKEQFERRASLTTAPEVKRNVSKPVVSKIAKPKSQSEERELPSKGPDSGTVRLQQIGIEPSPKLPEEIGHNGGVKKTESEPTHCTTTVDPSVLLQDARRSLQNSMAKLVEERAGEDSRRRAARDIISSAIRTGKPPVPYGRSSSAGVTSLSSPPTTPPGAPSTPPGAPSRTYRTEATHRVQDHRNRGASVERIIPIQVSEEAPGSPSAPGPPTAPPVPGPAPSAIKPAPAAPKINQVPLRRVISSESGGSDPSVAGEPIKKSAREFIIPIAVEGKGYVTPRQGSLEPERTGARGATGGKTRRISSLVSGGESEEEDESHMHRLRSSRAARAESVSSGEEEEDDEGFHLLTAENLFSTLLHRVRALTNRLNGEEGPGFPQHPHSLFNNLQSPFFNSPHMSRRHNALREGWGSRDLHADLDSMFPKRQPFPRGISKKSSKHQTKAQQNPESNAESGLDLSDLDLSSIQLSEKEMEALSGLTPALSRRLQKQLLAHLPPAAARTLRRTLSLQNTPTTRDRLNYIRSHSANKTITNDSSTDHVTVPLKTEPSSVDGNKLTNVPEIEPDNVVSEKESNSMNSDLDMLSPQYSTLPRPKRHSTLPRESTPPVASTTDSGYDFTPKLNLTLNKELSNSRGSSIRSTPDRPLLSKYLTPERAVSLDESYSSDSASILSEPSYIAAYGSPANLSGLGLRRHSMKLSTETPRKRISRFLRPDFFDATPQDENLLAKHKKEKELETQKVLREIREKKNKTLDTLLSPHSPTDTNDIYQIFKDENSGTRKCLSPMGSLTGKDRSRSNTPFFPILDNIKESALDTAQKYSSVKYDNDYCSKLKVEGEPVIPKESKLIRPKSYPVKNEDTLDEVGEEMDKENNKNKEMDSKEIQILKDSKLLRPKSYPTSSPSPEKVYISRNVNIENNEDKPTKQECSVTDNKSDVEVSFSISLPMKTKVNEVKNNESTTKQGVSNTVATNNNGTSDAALVLKKYQVVDNNDAEQREETNNSHEIENKPVTNGNTVVLSNKLELINEETKTQVVNEEKSKSKKENSKTNQSSETDTVNEKKATIKKKIIRKVSSKTKADVGESQEGNNVKSTTEKKKIVKKSKEKVSEDNLKIPKDNVPKKKSVLQSIGHKLEKLASSKSNSPDKDKMSDVQTSANDCPKKESNSKLNRNQREQSVPVQSEPPTESNLIKRAVTLTDVAALDNQTVPVNKTTVSKVLGLFKKSEPKDRVNKAEIPKISSEVNINTKNKSESSSDVMEGNVDSEKPKRPTSLLLNGLGRKNKYGRTASDSASVLSMPNNNICLPSESTVKKDESKNLRNSLKLDFSRLPRVKKIVPTNPVIEPQIIDTSCVFDKATEKGVPENDSEELNSELKSTESIINRNRSRSRSKSNISNTEAKVEKVILNKDIDNASSVGENTNHQPQRNHEPTTPEKDDIVERIRRKSFYTRFNEKRQRRKSNLVGPGATEYDPVARIHSQSNETKYDISPTSPVSYDVSPGFSSVTSDISPSNERYRSLITELPSRNNLRFDNYGLHDKVDSYRSLDRSDFRKYPSSRSYLDYDAPSTYANHRYTRTLSLLDSSDGTDENNLGHLREPQKYNRTLSLYAPGSYATYRPKRVRNSAIILKESEKEPSPENILEKIRQKKISISVTRKPDPDKESQLRSNVSSKSEGDGAECVEKVD